MISADARRAIHAEHEKKALNVFENYQRIGDGEIRSKYLERLQEELNVLILTNLFLEKL